MNKIKNIVFDLDGTLMQSNESIYKATIKTLEEFGIDPNFTEQEFNGRIGHHFKDIFAEFQTAVDDLEYFIERYKSHYFDFINDTKIYPGVIDVLDELKQRHIPASILTTKAQDQVEKIVDHFGIKNYFAVTMGRTQGIKIKPAPDMLLKICNYLSIVPAETLMVGDSELDIQCGKAAGAFTCAVTYGYRDTEILKSYFPDYLVDNIKEILGIIK